VCKGSWTEGCVFQRCLCRGQRIPDSYPAELIVPAIPVTLLFFPHALDTLSFFPSIFDHMTLAFPFFPSAFSQRSSSSQLFGHSHTSVVWDRSFSFPSCSRRSPTIFFFLCFMNPFASIPVCSTFHFLCLLEHPVLGFILSKYLHLFFLLFFTPTISVPPVHSQVQGQGPVVLEPFFVAGFYQWLPWLCISPISRCIHMQEGVSPFSELRLLKLSHVSNFARF